MTLTLQHDQRDEPADQAQPQHSDHLPDTLSEVVKSLPPRNCKNAEYIMKKISKSNVAWNSKGEFICQGQTMKGSHMIDLFKNLSLPYKKSQTSPPRGWMSFLNTLMELNIPLSSVNNPRARKQYRHLAFFLIKGFIDHIQSTESYFHEIHDVS